MGFRVGSLNSSSKRSDTGKSSKNTNIGVVIDVIYDDSHPRVSADGPGDGEAKRTGLIGGAAIRLLSDNTTPDGDLKIIRPYDAYDVNPPLIGETVEVINAGGLSFYKRLSNPLINQGNAKPNKNLESFPTDKNNSDNSSDYTESSNTGISSGGDSDRDTPIGEYFEPTQINPLKLYEGDRIIQSRHGQSIRFSGYNNTDNVLAPTILIRNRQNEQSIDELKEGSQTEEDVSKDGSTIAITSGDYKLDFQPGIVDDGGSTDFETTPSKFELPNELTGTDQILINSGRIILSAKDSEMIFYSRGDYGFISDGKLTIDNGLDGAELDFNGEVRITSNDFDNYWLGGQGKIYLNTESDAEPLVRGEVLLGLLEELIDAINAAIYQSPAGPTKPNPLNKSTFDDIKGRLSEFLSTLNYTE